MKHIPLRLPEWIPLVPNLPYPPPFTWSNTPWAGNFSTITEVPAGYHAIKESSIGLWVSWQGLPGDTAWLIEHAHGVLGKPRPLVCKYEFIIFQAGGLYFLLSPYPDDTADTIRPFDSVTWSEIANGSATLSWEEPPLRMSAYVAEVAGYKSLIIRDSLRGRNRWMEQKGRGGRPPGQCLITPDKYLAQYVDQ